MVRDGYNSINHTKPSYQIGKGGNRMVSELKDNQLEEKILKADRPVILDFWNEGCGPCQALRPVLEEVSEEEKDIDFYSIQIAQGKESAEHFRIMAAPTLLFIKDGTVKKKTLGFKSKESIQAIIEEHFK